MSPDEIRTDLDNVLELLEDLGAGVPALWRPPWGQCKIGVTRELAAERGLELVGWTINSADYDGRPATAMLAQIGDQLEAASATELPEVVLMHDCPLEPGQWSCRQNVNETIGLLRMLIGDDRWGFAPLAAVLRITWIRHRDEWARTAALARWGLRHIERWAFARAWPAGAEPSPWS